MLMRTFPLCFVLVLTSSQPTISAPASSAETAIEIGSRLELFVDDFLIEETTGIDFVLGKPTPQEIAIVHDEPWEGSGSGYHSVFQDGDLYRMYYKAWDLDVSEDGLKTDHHPLFCCYAESDDGIRWRKPDLGIHDFRGSKTNNIVMVSGACGSLRVDAGHPAVFKDDNPDAAPDARYKAILRSSDSSGLLPFKSPDGIHFSPMSDAPILTGLGAFDSQNLAFWDPVLGQYRAYWRYFTAGETSAKVWKPAGHRAIRTATSDDLIHWGETSDLTYVDSPPEQLYTNQIKPYFRAPHILIGFPSRYVERGWSPSMESLPELEHRRLRAKASERYGTAITDALFMSSRDGKNFKRWGEAFLRPGLRGKDNWKYGDNYIAWQVVETKSSIPDAPNELSLYATESYWTDHQNKLRRFTLRVDGFVSAQAPLSGGEILTKPLVFEGGQLELNFSTSAAGSIRVEIQEADGTPIEGYGMDDCAEVFGDDLKRVVTWKDSTDVSKMAEKPVRLRFVLKDADLYAFRFR
jgi:hypothetical protein